MSNVLDLKDIADDLVVINKYTIDSSDVSEEDKYTASVVSCGPVNGERFLITVEVIRPYDRKKMILNRLYDDFHAMQSILLKLFPSTTT